MDRLDFIAILKMLGKALFFTTAIAIFIVILGNVNQWDTPIQYSNAFFIAGGLIMIAGASLRISASQDMNQYLQTYAESFREMSASQQANFIVQSSSPVSLLILGLLSGLMLIGISVLVMILN